MLIAAFDPGQKGAVAILDDNGAIELLADLPIISDKSLTWVDGGSLQGMLLNAIRGRPCRAVVERVSAMPGQGVASSFVFGVGLGSILGVLQALHLPIELVTAASWKRAMGLSSKKAASLHKARLAFPTAELHLAKHDGRAEALLIATWARERRREVAA